MFHPKKILLMVLVIGGLLAIYLYQVKQYRRTSLERYFGDPRPGDIYKVKAINREQGYRVYYLKIADCRPSGIDFFPSYLSTGALQDIYLNHFDDSQTQFITRESLLEMRAGNGQWGQDYEVEILEITRK